MNPELNNQSADIIDMLRQRKLKIAFAESCTGGLLASSIVSISGASDVFKGSAVCYCDESKIEILNVSKSTLDIYFAESSQTATEMALGVLKLYKTDISVATTGFLDSNVGEKPKELANTVFVCLCIKQAGTYATYNAKIRLDIKNNRNENRNAVVEFAFNLLKSKIL